MNCRTNPLTICALTNDSEQIGSFAPPTELSEVIVVESGHAGCEEAITAARLGLNTALLTLNLDRIAWQPCNPVVGERPRANWCTKWMPSVE